MHELEHERLPYYQAALDMLRIADAIHDREQPACATLREAAMSLVEAIAVGHHEHATGVLFAWDPARAMAVRCAAALDACRVLRLGDEKKLTKARYTIERIVEELPGTEVYCMPPAQA